MNVVFIMIKFTGPINGLSNYICSTTFVTSGGGSCRTEKCDRLSLVMIYGSLALSDICNDSSNANIDGTTTEEE